VTYEPTREEKIRTIKLARALFENMATEYAPMLQEFGQTAKELLELQRGKPQPQTKPQEDPQERARLMTLLAEASKPKEGK
jgi:hypothetical protein